MQTENQSKNYYSLSVMVSGVKKKCRKIERHHFHLGNKSLNFDKSEIEDVVINSVKTNMKEIRSPIYVTLNYMTEISDGIVQWQIFDDRNVSFSISQLTIK